MKLSIAVTALVLALGNRATAFVPVSSTPKAAVGTATSSSALFLQPLASEGDWNAYLDEVNTGLVYYFNQRTGESLWQPPTRTFPTVRLAKAQRSIARKKQREYKQISNKQEGGSSEQSKGFLSGIFGGEEQQVTTQEEQDQDLPSWVTSKDPNWFKKSTRDEVDDDWWKDDPNVEPVMGAKKEEEVQKAEKKDNANWWKSDPNAEPVMGASEPKRQQDKEDESSWFGGVFDTPKQGEASAAATQEEQDQDLPSWVTSKDPNWFKASSKDEPVDPNWWKTSLKDDEIVIQPEKKLVPKKKEEPKKQQDKEEEPNWLGGLFDTPPKDQARPGTTKQAQPSNTMNQNLPGWVGAEDPNWWREKDDPVRSKKKVAEKPKKEEPSTGFSFDMFGSQEATKAPVNGSSGAASSATVEEKKTPAKKVTKISQDDEDQKTRFGGFRRVADVFKKGQTQRTLREPVEIEVASYVLPHPSKVSWGGEDAVFVKGRTFGVFDGVSGAEKLDGVPLYSKTLAEEAKNLIGDEGLNTKDISSVMLEAAEFADKAATGASTAVIASITDDGYLRVVNLGDSACLLVRDNVVRTKTREIVHYFECPYQLAEDSPDRPKDATKLNVEVLPGDIIVMGSDGIFDNLSDKAICDTIAEGPNDSSSAIAQRIVKLSRKVSLDTEAETPYAPLAKKNGDPEYKSGKGGKVDDASCVVVRCS